ncbi:MAG: amidophosphoribosyltransferase, partial [Chitinophagales bacterium]|nr:amidophosphoribosyltransferase [Chitinophagales bacterium]
ILKSPNPNAIKEVFDDIFSHIKKKQREHPDNFDQTLWLKQHVKYTGEVLLGHLRYGTHGRNNMFSVHPFIRENNWMTRNLVLAGNFNMVNNTELFKQLIALGQHPKERTDTVTVLEKIGHFLDTEVQELFDRYHDFHDNKTVSDLIATDLDVAKILSRSGKDFEGGYTIMGVIGHGDAFVMRDPNGIRPAYYFHNDEIAVAASERPAIMTVFDVPFENIKEVTPGCALVIKRNGKIKEEYLQKAGEKKSCSFERIYFSRGNDKEIYEERKMLGRLLTEKVLEAVHYDFDTTIFSFIPNTAEIAFNGLIKGIEEYLDLYKIAAIKNKGSDWNENVLKEILNKKPRVEKLAIKDVKMRTFITNDADRTELVSHVYDVTYGQVKNHVDTIVVLDDSIVRGTTLKESIIAILDRLHPKKIIIVSSAPQIRYPDCYGIDMSKMSDFVAFKAAIDLTLERGNNQLLQEIYQDCKKFQHDNSGKVCNFVKQLYEQFTDEEISKKVSEIVKAKQIEAEVEIIYQTVENLHKACPENKGDWYFTGDYPTPNGNRVANKAFMNFMDGKDVRAYD